jgi:hypothetical protein
MLSVEMVNHEWASVFCGKELASWWDLDSGTVINTVGQA